MEFAPGSELHGFEISRCEALPEIDGDAIEGVHAASGAKLLYLRNDDNNKAFAIGFRTPPADDTGVFHILEHSVLCGSRRFPVKEPFVDLLKGSMQTFLNAMTFADKTLYPVASTNEQDLLNLMDVYLDAVFHPNIYVKRQIFEQEGWHYELAGAEGGAAGGAEGAGDAAELAFNGVVFNEMKGALSDANSVLYDEIQAALFPGTCYAFESGGTPEAIPTLTYEGYLDEHRRHYRTDNSYIVLYGNLDIDRVLAFLDERYLSPVAGEQAERDAARAAEGLEPLRPRGFADALRGAESLTYIEMPQLSDRCGGSTEAPEPIAVPSSVKLPDSVKRVDNPPRGVGGMVVDPASAEAPVGTPFKASAQPGQTGRSNDAPATMGTSVFVRREMDTAPENACAGVGYVVGASRERTRAMAADILLDALLGSNEAPLKRALLDAGIAHDVHAFVSDALLEPFAVVQLQMPAPGAAEALADAVASEVARLLDEGLDRELVEAALSHAEFQMREHDMGVADGVANAMIALTGWLYDDDAATAYLRYGEAFAEMRARLDEGYFEQLARELFCENARRATVEVVPAPGEVADANAERLAEKARSLTDGDREQIEAEVALLRELQEAPDSPEAVATLPRLSIADIDDAPAEPRYDLDWKTPLTCVRHSVATNGIAYAYRYFDLDGLAFEDLPYVSVLALVLGKLDTARHTAAELDTLVQGKLGNLSFFTDVYEHKRELAHIMPKLVVSSSALAGNADWLATLPREIMLETDFSDAGKVLDVLKQRKIGMEHAFANNGHTCAMARLKSYYAPTGIVREQMGNVGFYRFLCELIEHYDERAGALAARLAEVAARVFCDDRCTVSFAGPDDAYDRFWLSGAGCDRRSDGARALEVPEPRVLGEAFAVPSDVCYAACGWDRRLLGAEHSGTWAVAARALSFDYLWNEVRVKGGAYGAGFQALRTGSARFYSYRDPHLDSTLARFGEAGEWLSGFDPSREDLEGFVVATVAGFDAPVKPRELIRRQMGDFFMLRRPEERVELRRQVIETGAGDVRALGGVVGEVASAGAVCVFGAREILEGASADLEIVPLVG